MSLIKCMLALLGFDAGDIAIFAVPGYRNETRWRFAFRAETFVPNHYLAGRDLLKFMAGMYQRRFDLDACI